MEVGPALPLAQGGKSIRRIGFQMDWKVRGVAEVVPWHSDASPGSSYRPHSVLSFGFRKGSMVEDVVAIMRECLHAFDVWGAATAWNGPYLFTGSQDVETAFDTVDHEEEAVGMVLSGVPTRVAAVLARESVGVDLIYDLPKAGFTEPVPLEQGMVQGRIDAPAWFRIFLDHILAPVVKLWVEAGFGVRWGFRGRRHSVMLSGLTTSGSSRPALPCTRAWLTS